MKLNETIRRLRRAKGLTQEQVAQALGVSGPAVNKWERGACCPDLALLAPLARLLDTDLNTLLSFREELTGAEIAAFTEELYTLAQSRGIDAAFLRAEELLHRWPGCDRLTISLAMTLNGLFFTLGVAEPEPYERRLEPLYRALADSEEPDIRDQALHLLIGRHMRREEYAAAEELLSSLSDRWPHRDALQAGLLRRTGRGEEAAELWERRLLNAATEVYESLVSLQELALQAERLEDGARLAALIEETAERYALIPGVASSGRLQQAAAEGDKTAALSALRDMLEALNRSWDGGGLYPHLLPGTQVAVGSVLLPGLLLELQREPELAFLQDEPEFQALLSPPCPTAGPTGTLCRRGCSAGQAVGRRPRSCGSGGCSMPRRRSTSHWSAFRSWPSRRSGWRTGPGWPPSLRRRRSVTPSFPASPPPDGSNRPRQRGTRRPPCLPCGICWRRSTAPGTAGGSIPTFCPVRRWPSGPFCCPACCWSSSGSPNWLSSRTSRNFRPC